MKLTMLGTGNAMASKCYNTCFLISDGQQHFLVDGGGGNAILHQLESIGLSYKDIKEIFVTHKHIDHLLGILWLIRAVCQCFSSGQKPWNVHIYASKEVIDLLLDISGKLLLQKQTRFIGSFIHLIPIWDGEVKNINGRDVTFFDIGSAKDLQFGFCMELGNHKKLTCCGDEPCHPCGQKYVENSAWLLHESFCLYSQAGLFAPYEKYHATVKDACEFAESMCVTNLVLYHTEDRNLSHRKELYCEEGRRYFHGNLYVPDDLETIELS